MKKTMTTQAKPDYIDIDGDGNKKESMKEAAKSVATQHKTNSWEEEDKKRGRKFAAEGKMGHAEALFDDAHDSYNWKGGNDGHESWFHKFKKKNPVTQLKAPSKKFKDFDQMDTWDAKETAGEDSPTTFKDFDQMDTWDAKSIAKQTSFQNLMQKYPTMSPNDTIPANDPRQNIGWPTAYSEDLNKAFDDTYGNTEGWEIEEGDVTDAEARAKAQLKIQKDKEALKTQAVKDSLYQEHLKKMSKEEGPVPQNKTMAYKKSCAYRQDGHGQSKGDQSATHTDYANYKGTDKGYHGKDGSSHGDQSATHRDYAHPILKHMKR